MCTILLKTLLEELCRLQINSHSLIALRKGKNARGTRGGEGQGPASLYRKYQIHRWAVQAQDADRAHHAWLCGKTTKKPWRRELGVPLQTPHHHRQRPWLRESQGNSPNSLLLYILELYWFKFHKIIGENPLERH